MKVSVDDVTIRIGPATIVESVSIDVASGSFHAVVGPNGSGKSTLLRSIYRSLRPVVGRVLFADADVWSDLSARTAAQRRAVVTQDSSLDFDYTVTDVVAMGRSPHKSLFERDTTSDREIVVDALQRVEMGWAAERLIATLSGGERQRVFLARAIAQQTQILVLDEPTNHLDVRAQLELLALVKSLGVTTIAALHDLDHAVGSCDGITVLDRGRVAASGAPDQVLLPHLIRTVFGVDAHIGTHPLTGRPHITTALVADRPTLDNSAQPNQPPGDPSC